MASERILVVDDGADMRDFVINYVIKPNGYAALEASDGMEALDIIMDAAPDLILLDLQMPRLDGLGLLRRMKEEDIHIPVVLMTFFGSEEIAIEVFRLGVRDYVIKPFTDDELLVAIEKALVETRLRRTTEVIQQRLTRANDKLSAQLADFHHLLTITLDYDDQLAALVQLAADSYGTTAAALLTLDEASEDLVTRLEVGPHHADYDTVVEAARTQQVRSHAECIVCPVDSHTVLSVTLAAPPPTDHLMLFVRAIAAQIGQIA